MTICLRAGRLFRLSDPLARFFKARLGATASDRLLTSTSSSELFASKGDPNVVPLAPHNLYKLTHDATGTRSESLNGEPHGGPMMPNSGPAVCQLKCANTRSCSECREFEELEAEVANAKRRRALFLVRVNERTDTLTSKLPVEIICYIFEAYMGLHCIDTTDESFQSHQSQARPRLFPVTRRSVPLSLGAVCHRWRQLAWSHPRLWSTILIDLASPVYPLGPDLVSEWLKRSGNLPLNIRVDDDEDYFYHPPDIINHGKQVMRSLNQYAARWRSLDVSGVSLEILAELDDSSSLEPSILEHFSFGGHPRDSRPNRPPKTILRTTKRRHRPTHLALLLPISPSLIKVDWSWVTHLYVANMSRRWAFEAMEYAARSGSPITHLYLDHITDPFFQGDLGWSPASMIPFSSVTFLSIVEAYKSPFMARETFTYLTLPNLKQLVFDGHRVDTLFPTDHLLDLLDRSGFSLTSLALSKPVISNDDLLRLLRAMPTIQELKLELPKGHISTPFLECFSQRVMRNKSEPPLLPSLVRLDMEAISPEDWVVFIAIFDDHPLVPGPPKETLLRKDLKITFTMLLDIENQNENENGNKFKLMDDHSMQKLIHLWREHGVLIDFRFGAPLNSKEYSFLLASFDRDLLVDPPTPEEREHPTYIAIEEMRLATFQ